ncbi:flavin-containing monooxygenase YUCCA3 [Favolaschia claudopus]|uniref:Flavin-containing monooxygenase YUCCA3 n=1 Tax=Favolaschia claudopus TaxID=2862362 RepID=A0AAV9ZMM0_9AGAR
MPNFHLPTFERLNATVPTDVDVDQVAATWMRSLSQHAEEGNARAVTALFIQDSYWRDMLALTWNFRTFHGAASIAKFLADRLLPASLANFRIKESALQPLGPDLAWIRIAFNFTVKDVGNASGIVRLVPQSDGVWQAWGMYTNLEGLEGFPERIGALRPEFAPGSRAESRNAADNEPVVVIVGGGHSGLALAARLKALDVRALVVEKNARVGDNWRNRYDKLRLHDPVWYDHMPYLPFPPTWPIYTPAKKLANWLETYADALDLDVWTSSTVLAAQPSASGNWKVVINRDGAERVFSNVHHVVFATGWGGGQLNVPSFPGMDRFKGEMMHSAEYKRSERYKGKKVVVIGACVSAHDVAADCYSQGIDVTMYQRTSTYVMSTGHGLSALMKPSYWEGGPPTENADRDGASLAPRAVVELYRRLTGAVAEADRELLDGLRGCGFRVNMGIEGTGSGLLSFERGGGYYLDVGASELLISGKIKLKNDSLISGFTERGVRFEDGSDVEADVVVFATGFGDARDTIRKVCGDAVGDRCARVWGLDEEGEVNGAWRGMGVRGLWYMMGNLAMSRFYSKHLALQIKAMEEGVFGERYGA